MGIVVRQSIYISIATYLGVILGYINVVILFPRFLTAEQFGLTRILLALAAILVQFSQLGSGHILLRYFPLYRDNDKNHNGFLFFIFMLNLVGMSIFTIAAVIFKDLILNYYNENSGLISDYYYYIIPIFCSLLLFRTIVWYAQSIYKSVFYYYIKEVFVRIFNLIILFAFFLNWIHFELFIFLFVMANVLQLIIALIYMKNTGELLLKPDFSVINFKKMKEMFFYGMTLFLSTASVLFISNIDILMLGSMAGLTDVAVYSVAFLIGNVIQIPARAIKNVASPIISKAWQNNDIKQINDLYKKTSINQMIMGLLLFIGLWVNMDNILQFLPGEYGEGKYVIIFISLGQLFGMAIGLNDEIIFTSKHYKFDLVVNVLLVILAVTTNYIFIPKYGINGAAFATALSLFLYSVIKTCFVINKFKLFPFTINTIKLLLITGIAFAIGMVIPVIDNIWLDIFVRSSAVLLIYVSLTLAMHVSEDVNKIVFKFIPAKIKRDM